MNCDDARRLIAAYNDGELDLVRNLEVEEHLRSCDSCALARENLRALQEAAQSAYFQAPDGLRESVLAALGESAPIPRSAVVRRDSRSWVTAGLALAAGVLLGFFVAQALVRHSSEQTLLAELTDSHVRSLIGTHLTDVISSDQHTVRPWFEGKLDFAPPVADLSGQGFPLVGGRAEYIDGRSVAALVYERRKHFINLFVWPSQPGTEQVKGENSQRGYNIVRWRAAGMNYAAVSEVAEDDLRKFSVAFSDATTSAR
jgi:anti-sigma factor RsiW